MRRALATKGASGAALADGEARSKADSAAAAGAAGVAGGGGEAPAAKKREPRPLSKTQQRKLEKKAAEAQQREADKKRFEDDPLSFYPSVQKLSKKKLNMIKKLPRLHEMKWRERPDDGLNWNIRVAMVLERMPIITPDLEQFEIDYIKLEEELEERFGVDLPNEYYTDKEEDKAAEEAERLLRERLGIKDEKEQEMKREIMPRRSEADRTNNRRSLSRRMDLPLYMLVKKKGSTSERPWTFPEGPYEANFAPRAVAYRVFQQQAGKDIDIELLGNAPIGHVERVFEKKNPSDPHGEKLFFFRGLYMGGELELAPDIEDYLWIAREELHEYVAPDVAELAQRMLYR